MSTLPKLVSTTVPALAAVPRQLCIMFDSIRLQGMSALERTKVIACLAVCRLFHCPAPSRHLGAGIL